MDYKNIITPERFREKQLKLYNDLGCDLAKMPKKKDSYWVLDENGQVLCFMTCIVCKKDKERTIDNYIASHVNNKDVEAWFAHYKAGCESFKNSAISPCKTCRSTVVRGLKANSSMHYFKYIIGKYKLKYEDFLKIWDNLEYSPITCIPKRYLIPSAESHLAPSVYKVNESYIIDLCVLHSQHKVNMEDLFDIFKNLYKYEIEHECKHENDKLYCDEIQKWYDSTSIELGIDPNNNIEVNKKNLKRALGIMVYNHKKDDKEAKRSVGNATCADYLQVLLDHKVRCDISNIRLSIQKGLHTDVSIDRIDNEQSHNVGNLRPIAIIFQASGKRQFTRKQFLHMCLVQNAHPLTLGSKRRITKEHDALNQNCPFCEIDKLQGNKL
jgi:hypothetical protein